MQRLIAELAHPAGSAAVQCARRAHVLPRFGPDSAQSTPRRRRHSSLDGLDCTAALQGHISRGAHSAAIDVASRAPRCASFSTAARLAATQAPDADFAVVAARYRESRGLRNMMPSAYFVGPVRPMVKVRLSPAAAQPRPLRTGPACLPETSPSGAEDTAHRVSAAAPPRSSLEQRTRADADDANCASAAQCSSVTTSLRCSKSTASDSTSSKHSCRVATASGDLEVCGVRSRSDLRNGDQVQGSAGGHAEATTFHQSMHRSSERASRGSNSFHIAVHWPSENGSHIGARAQAAPMDAHAAPSAVPQGGSTIGVYVQPGLLEAVAPAHTDAGLHAVAMLQPRRTASSNSGDHELAVRVDATFDPDKGARTTGFTDMWLLAHSVSAGGQRGSGSGSQSVVCKLRQSSFGRKGPLPGVAASSSSGDGQRDLLLRIGSTLQSAGNSSGHSSEGLKVGRSEPHAPVACQAARAKLDNTTPRISLEGALGSEGLAAHWGAHAPLQTTLTHTQEATDARADTKEALRKGQRCAWEKSGVCCNAGLWRWAGCFGSRLR